MWVENDFVRVQIGDNEALPNDNSTVLSFDISNFPNGKIIELAVMVIPGSEKVRLWADGQIVDKSDITFGDYTGGVWSNDGAGSFVEAPQIVYAGVPVASRVVPSGFDVIEPLSVYAAQVPKHFNSFSSPAPDLSLANAIYSEISTNISTNTPQVTGIFIKPDGTRMFLSDFDADNIVQYELSTPWDIRTKTFTKTYSVGGVTQLSAVFWKIDGTRFYAADESASIIHEFTPPVSWDVGGVVVVGNTFDPGLSGLQGMYISDDGLTMFTAHQDGNGKIRSFDLSTPWDITSAVETATFEFGFATGSTESVFLNPDKTKMFTVARGTDDIIRELSLTNAGQASPATIIDSLDLEPQGTTPTGAWFKPDGKMLFTCNIASDELFQYNL